MKIIYFFYFSFINFVVPVIVYLKAKQVQWLLGTSAETSYANIQFGDLPDLNPVPDFHPHKALPKFIDSKPFVIVGITIGISLWITYLIILNIFVDLFVIFT